MIHITRKWPPEKVGLPSRHAFLRDDDGRELEMVAQYGKSFIGRVDAAVAIVDDAKSVVRAASAEVFEGRIRRVRVLEHDGTLDDAFRAAFRSVYGLEPD